MRSLKFSMLARVRWLRDLTAFLVLALLLTNESCEGAPKAQGHNSKGVSNPFLPSSGPFRVVTEVEDEPESREFSPSGHFHFGSSFPRSHLSGKVNSGLGTSGSFGVPLSAVPPRHQSGSRAITVSHSSTRTGTPRTSSHFTVDIDRSVEDDDRDDDDLVHSHFSVPGASFKTSSTSDDISIEDVVSLESMSLGRRFHPHGIPRRSDPPPQHLTRDSLPVAAIANPFIFNSNLDFKDSLEDDDDDDIFVPLSPLVRSQNHNLHSERLSLSNDFMSQYNFVDVKGSINWGYKTDDQYQDHQVHKDGSMNGNFGWTAPEGSKVSIKYIADKGGYRVVSSSGLYTEEADDVLLQKAIHFSEHDKARAKLASVRNSKKPAAAGFPHVKPSGPGFVVVVDDDDDFPLIAGGQGGAGNQGTFGVPLPDPGVTLQSGAPSRPPPGQGFGVPLPDPGITIQFGAPTSPPSGQEFGVSLPDPSVTLQSGAPSGPPSGQGFGVPLPDPSVTLQSGAPSGPPSGQGFGVPLPDPSVTLQSGDPSGPPSGQGFGVPLPDPSVTLQSGDPSGPPPGQGFGVPFPDPSVTLQSGDPSSPPSGQGFGVPLPDPSVTLQSGNPSSSPSGPGFGVPLPDFTVTFETGEPSSPSSAPGFGVPLADPSLTVQSGDPPAPPSGQAFGVPLSDPATSHQPGAPSRSSPGSEVGVAAPGSGSSFQSSSDQGFPISSTGNADPSLGDQFGIPLSNPSPNQGFDSSSFGVPLPDLSSSSPAVPSTTNQGFEFSATDSPSSSSGSDFGISSQGPKETSGHSFGVALSETTANQGFESQDSGIRNPSSHSRPISSHQGFGLSDPDQANDTPIGSDFGTPLIASSGPISGNPGSNAPREDGTFGIPLGEIGSSSFDTNQGQSLDSFIGRPNEIPDDNLGFGLGLSSVSTGSSSSSSSPSSSSSTGQSFGIPLSSVSGSLGKPSGPAATPPRQGSSNFIIIPDDDQFVAAAGSSSDGIGSFPPFGGISDDKLKTEVGLSPHGVQESSGSFVFSNNDENLNPASVGVSLSSASSPGANRESSIAGNSNSFGVSLASLLSDKYPSSAGDLLQGPPFEELGSSVTGGSEGSTDFDPCKNSKIHPSLLPPECFLSAASAQPDQRIGKSLSQTDSKNEAQDSFIVVVNSDLFQ